MVDSGKNLLVITPLLEVLYQLCLCQHNLHRFIMTWTKYYVGVKKPEPDILTIFMIRQGTSV
uniref:Uncharacterized protein n=1 Tax=Rhizophora mucronata TaxID=61149 RepID=A0A2P2R0W9_RHIMU